MRRGVCSDNGVRYKSIFVRTFGGPASATRDEKYIANVHQQAANVGTSERDSLNRVGQQWNGVDSAQLPNVRNKRTKASGVGALVAALGL